MVMVLVVISKHMFKHIFKFNSKQAHSSEHVLTSSELQNLKVGHTSNDHDMFSSAHASRIGYANRGGGTAQQGGGNGLTFCVNWKLISNTDDTDLTDFHGYEIRAYPCHP